MSKQAKIFIAIFGLLIGGIIFLSISPKKNPLILPISNNTATPTASISDKTKTYIDPAGFKFSYPENINLTKEDILDKITYSKLKLSSNDQSGEIIISITASQLELIDNWFKNNKNSSVSGEIKKVKLADLEAKQFKLNSQIQTIALDKGVLIKITATSKDNFWPKINDKIISTFTFIQPDQPNSSNSQSSSDNSNDVVYEGEEVVE